MGVMMQLIAAKKAVRRMEYGWDYLVTESDIQWWRE